jgi:hypothetical protein
MPPSVAFRLLEGPSGPQKAGLVNPDRRSEARLRNCFQNHGDTVEVIHVAQHSCLTCVTAGQRHVHASRVERRHPRPGYGARRETGRFFRRRSCRRPWSGTARRPDDARGSAPSLAHSDPPPPGRRGGNRRCGYGSSRRRDRTSRSRRRRFAAAGAGRLDFARRWSPRWEPLRSLQDAWSDPCGR